MKALSVALLLTLAAFGMTACYIEGDGGGYGRGHESYRGYDHGGHGWYGHGDGEYRYWR
jgi:hypothetical protein